MVFSFAKYRFPSVFSQTWLLNLALYSLPYQMLSADSSYNTDVVSMCDLCRVDETPYSPFQMMRWWRSGL
jgi:hypothetical protein